MTILIQTEGQSLQTKGLVSLFTLDATKVGGGLMYFVQGSKHDDPVVFNGIPYAAADVEFEGLETSGVGALPTPIIRVSNTDGLFQSIINTYGDLLGCNVYRIRTFERFLDGEDDADPSAIYGPDIFRFERKAIENALMIEWELSTSLDQEAKQIPGRQIIRETCLWRYRAVNANGVFDYSKAQCPYAGTQSYDINDLPVSDPTKDVPSRRLSCCRTRFGAANPLPFGGFTGVSRSR